ncbi:MAG: phytanoyl-CoA dioxygenase family protein [bacterium]|nr:phytanoyl-CoA dioxygenase family protein [bacterium]
MNTETLEKPYIAPVKPGFAFSDLPSEQPEPDYPFPALTLEERMRFELFGYTIVEDLFTEQELQSIEAAAKKAKNEILEAAENRTFEIPPPPNKYHPFKEGAIWRGLRTTTESGELYLDRLEIEQVLGLNPIFLSALTKPRVLGIATELLGGTFRFFSVGVRFNRRSNFPMLGWHGGVSRHKDRAVCKNGWLHTQILGMIVYLTDVGPTDGGTGIFAGSHRLDLSYDVLKKYITDHPDSELFHQVVARRGSTLLFADGPLMHRTIPIQSDKERLIMLSRMVHSDYEIGQTEPVGRMDQVSSSLMPLFHGRAFTPKYRPRGE